MFWSGNYIVDRELKFLLKKENVTLTQVLEADDILQECNADNKDLIQYLTKPDILSELIGLITEEPPKNVELTLQYRHANIASEVLTSNLSMLRDRLSMDATQMNRLCNFVNKDPPLNPLLASYFSKTIKMLLERSPKQDWYLHNIVCLQVIEFFKSRRDFLPNLLKHISTSAICDIFKCFLELYEGPQGSFSKFVLEWFDEHQFLESLIQIICGTYNPNEIHYLPIQTDKCDKENEGNDKFDSNHNATEEETPPTEEAINKNEEKIPNTNGEVDGREIVKEESVEAEKVRNSGKSENVDNTENAANLETAENRRREVAAANAAALLYDIALELNADIYNIKWCVGRGVALRLRSADSARRLLQGVFTSSPSSRSSALVHATQLLLALLRNKCENLERALAPHLPLLHHALLKPQEVEFIENKGVIEEKEGRKRVGAARVQVAALLAKLAQSEVDDVPNAIISLGTANILLELMFSFPHNNFLHAQVCALVAAAVHNAAYARRYAQHLLGECDLLTRLMDAFEENEDRKTGVRAGYMGHLITLLRALDASPAVCEAAGAAQPLGERARARWAAFRETKLRPVLLRHDTPLGGSYPSENSYEMDNVAALEDSYDYRAGAEAGAGAGAEAEAADGDAHALAAFANSVSVMDSTKNSFLELASERFNDDTWWDDAPDAAPRASPWENTGEQSAEGTENAESAGGEEGWAQFDAFSTHCAADPFWGASDSQEQNELKQGMQNMHVSGFDDDDKETLTFILAQKMLDAFQNMNSDTADPANGLLAEPSAGPQSINPSSDSAVNLSNASPVHPAATPGDPPATPGDPPATPGDPPAEPAVDPSASPANPLQDSPPSTSQER